MFYHDFINHYKFYQYLIISKKDVQEKIAFYDLQYPLRSWEISSKIVEL